jgi:post-segregation antitoxin (ccd killing protein)
VKIITVETVEQARRKKTGRTPARQVRIDNAIDALQSAILDLNVCRAPTYGQSMAVGRARKDLWAAINAKERAERLEA